MGRTIVTGVVAILCTALGYVAGVHLGMLGYAILHPSCSTEATFTGGMFGAVFFGPACASGAGIYAVVCGYRGSHLFRFLGIMTLLMIIPYAALACLSCFH